MHGELVREELLRACSELGVGVGCDHIFLRCHENPRGLVSEASNTDLENLINFIEPR